MGLGIRLLPTCEEDSRSASRVKFSTKFERNRRDKRAAIHAASIFPESMNGDAAKKRLELETKRRKINAASASTLVTGKFKPLLESHTPSHRSRSGAKNISIIPRER